MLNVPDLESRWSVYQRKQRLPIYIFAIVFFLTILIVLFYVFSAKESESATKKIETLDLSSSSSVAIDNNDAQDGVVQSKLSNEHVDEKRLRLEPSMDFVQDIEVDDSKYYFDEATVVKKSSEIKSVPKRVEQRREPEKDKRSQISSIVPSKEAVALKQDSRDEDRYQYQTRVQNSEPEGSMLIERKNDMKSINDVLKRFKKNKNPALSLFVAKRYYALGNYQQAYNYALTTNELDSSIEDSWLIFAKSLYHLDQKDVAIRTLRSYLEQSSSIKARIAIEQMQNGELR